ncbi:uncharacterized protein STEHIDRAFT_139781 [Stereum hirsutum FP-91666 SS1]|uniref:uncharacterized protein n=1 Tax=Stereum hirsutum (strain FP-91666) TaxID=721885 RepID=UPI000444A82D|nr:uncharacterized protein STEHIDRAFT_139781 [Stereum hirsutum FP-91666 SS1]EIM85963.1 hypothetical protein STEHIDRAFT_139781 [Stereum hirsutum FP-91666 SS1]
MDSDSDSSSRILVVHSSLDQARHVVQRIRALADDTSDLPAVDSNPNGAHPLIPWTISNKYYTADVHFKLVSYAALAPDAPQNIPAVIYVWERGTPYSEQVLFLSNLLSQHDPEVSLAIGLGPKPSHPSDPEHGPDSFLAEHGFEYIDGDRTEDSPHTQHQPPSSISDVHDLDADADTDGGVQGLPRVLDALSTIMWPSMTRNDGRAAKRKSQMPMLFDVLPSEEEGLASLMSAEILGRGGEGLEGLPTRDMRMKKEMAELERWLIDNEDLHEREEEQETEESEGGEVRPDARFSLKFEDDEDVDPWTRTDLLGRGSGKGTGGGGTTPSTEVPPTRSTPAVDGFEDDFTTFVSAPSPSEPQPQTHLQLQPHLHTSEGTHLQIPTPTGTSFRSTSQGSSSFSDFGTDDDFLGHGHGHEHGYQALSDDHEHDHDPEQEPHNRSSSLVSDFDPTSDMHGDTSAFNPWTTDTFSAEPSSSTFPPSSSSTFPPTSSSSSSKTPRAPDFGIGTSLDLADILSTLQSVREGVAGMGDEDARRAIGARVASEFVIGRMGMGGDEGEGEGGDEGDEGGAGVVDTQDRDAGEKEKEKVQG